MKALLLLCVSILVLFVAANLFAYPAYYFAVCAGYFIVAIYAKKALDKDLQVKESLKEREWKMKG